MASPSKRRRINRRARSAEAPVKATQRLGSGLFFRQLHVRRDDLDADARTLRVSFSSEAPVERWFGREVLLHGPDNVDLARIQRGASVLLNHDPDQIVGGVASVEIGDDRRGYAVLRFDEDEEGERALRKVRSGSLSGVSVAYEIADARQIEANRTDDESGIEGPGLVATRWTPYEISLTPIAADPTVGVGRDASRSLDGIRIERESTEKQMDPRTRTYLELLGLAPDASEEDAWAFLETLVADAQAAADEAGAETAEETAAAAAAATAETASAEAAQTDAAGADAPPAEEEPRSISREMYDQAAAVGQEGLALRLLSEGRSEGQIHAAILKAVAAERGAPMGPGATRAPALDKLDTKTFARALSVPSLGSGD